MGRRRRYFKKTLTRRAGRLHEYGDYDGDIAIDCDALVIGSGPGGALAAYELAKAGKSVVILEAGPKVRHGETRRDAGMVLNRFFFYGGMRSTRGNTVMPSMQPRNLGGGSVWNSAICMRFPQFVLDRYENEHELPGFATGRMDRHFAAVESFMGVRPVADDVLGQRNELFAKACENVGFKATRIDRNESGCKGSSECFTLCPNDAKLSMDRRGIPEVLELGGSVYTSVSAHELIKEGRSVRGVRGFVVHPDSNKRSYRVEVRAKVTIMAAGCLATPEILQRSRVGNDRVGKNLRFHPGSMVMGEFEEDIQPWSGATQGFHCLDFMEEGIKLESLWATSSLMGCRFPGLGFELQTLLKNYRKMCSWDCWVSGEDSVGHIQQRPGRRADIVYNIGQGEADRMTESMAKLSEMFFSVGAKSVMTGVHGLQAPAYDRSIIDTLRSRSFKVQEVPFASNHIFGTTAMGGDPSRHAVDPSGALYDAEDIYICDTGLLPSTPGANPMMPTMAIVHMICEHINRRY